MNRCLTVSDLMIVICSVLMVNSTRAQSLPTGFSVDTLVSTGLNAPLDFEILPDGRILIAEKFGAIKLKRPGLGGVTTIGSVPNVQTGSERGLLSIVVKGSELYTWASRSTTNNMVLSRFTLVGNLNDPTSTSLSFASSSEYVIVNNAPDLAFNHNGGTIRFGPDGMLYLSIGDDANCADASKNTKMAGVLLRLDVDGLPAFGPVPSVSSLAPADNPYITASNANKQVVIANGLRNPYSMCIDEVTGDLFVADVGQSAREELNWFPRNMGQPIVGKSFGWPWREGFIAYNFCGSAGPNPGGHTAPIDDRLYSSGGRSIICAGVVRNMGGPYDFGPAYEFNVFHNDYYNGTIERLVLNTSTNSWSNAAAVAGQPTTAYWGTGFAAAPHFDLGPDGAIYFVQRASTGANTGGFLKRIRGGGPVYSLAFADGDNQICTSGETFGTDLKVKLTNISTTNVVSGIEVVFSSEDGSASFGPGPFITDVNGEVSVTVTSTGVGDGDVNVEAFAIGAAPIAADLWGRKLEIVYVPGSPDDTMFVDFFNKSNAPAPVLPVLLALTLDVQPIYPTFFGDLHIDLITLQNTFIIEDGGNSFGGANFGPTPPLATPSWSTTYMAPAGIFTGLTYRFQLITYDVSVLSSQVGSAATNLGLSNPVSVTYQ